MADAVVTIGTGVLLGWSVAWPPGPINAEMIRRGLTCGFWPALAVGMGACCGDFLWALAVAYGTGAASSWENARPLLAVVSLLLLLFLAWTFLSGAIRAWKQSRANADIQPAAGRFDGSQGGYLLGLTLALSSPWNIAFWLAVLGTQTEHQMQFSTSLLLATSVVFTAASWSLLLCLAVRLGARFATPAWGILTQALTGLLMLYFAVKLLIRLASS